MLLHEVRGPKSFADLKTVNGRVCQTFREACHLRGLLEDDSHWDATLAEAAVSSSANQLRNLFAIMLLYCGLSNPQQLWENHKKEFSEDFFHQAKQKNPRMEITLSEPILNQALLALETKVIQLGGNGLQDFGMPAPERDSGMGLPQDILREMSYNIDDLAREVREKEAKLLEQQRAAYDTIVDSVKHSKGGLFFLDAPGGTGKTFLINLLLAKTRMHKCIALAVASSGIAATLLNGGRTAHSAFKLPLDLTRQDTPLCNISKSSAMAKVLQKAKLIVWDECTMSHKGALEAVDRTLRDLRDSTRIMGGATVVLSGDFRQTLPVVPKGTKADELKACIKASPLWSHVQKLHLSTNMRAKICGDQTAQQFSEELLRIGNGQLKLNTSLQLHELPCGQMVQSTEELKKCVFPNINTNFKNPSWFCERAILAPRNDSVDKINLDLLRALPGTESSYHSVDTMIDSDMAVQYPVEFLNSLQPPGMPPHNLILKIGVPIMLLRNLDAPRLCNGTRLIIKSLKHHVIEATIITGNFKGEDVFIPRIPLIPSDLPFQFKRLQFPIRLSFAMSINKSQGQSLKVVGLNLQTPCFSHGQLYVGCSRVGSAKNLFICTPKQGFSENIVYPEVLHC